MCAERRFGKRPELLAPAGGPEPFAAALAAGADAIYCGMGEFNARRKAQNFTDESFAQACRMAHLAGARVYVTVNIVIKESEIASALELVRHCTELGADAFIIQDWGLFAEVRRCMPQVETHISTQANIHDARGAAWCKDAGADRVTLSRELSVDEIAAISPVGVDLEVFAHGSICFCYSGVCLLSSFACSGRSANRGMCAQPCRLPYELIDAQGRSVAAPGRERPLCPRDTNTSQMLDELLDAGAHALKLEGRMKAPDYVYSIVDVYRRELDDILGDTTASVEEREARARQLKRCFNRDFTTAYQRGTSGDEMMSYERSNNRGQIVGEVLRSRTVGAGAGLRPDDRRNKIATALLALTEPVGEGDLLELRHDDEFDQFLTVLAPRDAKADEELEVRIPRAMPAHSRVRVIRSQAAIDTAAAALKREVPRKRKVDVRVVARLGEPFSVTLTCCDDASITATAAGFTVEPARTRPVAAQDLVEHVGRMGSSAFEAASFDVQLDEGCGMGFSAVHKVRAAACEALEDEILRPYEAKAREVNDSFARATGSVDTKSPAQTVLLATKAPLAPSARAELAIDFVSTDSETVTDSRFSASHGDEKNNGPLLEACTLGARACSVPGVVALVTSLEDAEVARGCGATSVYMSSDALEACGVAPSEVAGLGVVPVLDEVCRLADRERLDAWVVPGSCVAVGNISELACAAERGAAAQIRSCIPVHNVAAARMLAEHGARGVWLSPELTLAEIEQIGPAMVEQTGMELGIEVFGRPRVMTSEHCILQTMDACIHDCAKCRLRQRRYSLKNIDGKVFPVRTDMHGRSHLYEAKPVDITPQIPQLLAAGVTRFMVDGTLMGSDELKRAVTHAVRALEAAKQGRRPDKRQQGTTNGCLFVGVD